MAVQSFVVEHMIDCTAVAVEEHTDSVAVLELHSLAVEVVARRIDRAVQAEGEHHIVLEAGVGNIDLEEEEHHIDRAAAVDGIAQEAAGVKNSMTLVGEHYSLVEGLHRELVGNRRAEEHRTARLEVVGPIDFVAAGVALPILPAESSPVPDIDFASVFAVTK